MGASVLQTQAQCLLKALFSFLEGSPTAHCTEDFTLIIVPYSFLPLKLHFLHCTIARCTFAHARCNCTLYSTQCQWTLKSPSYHQLWSTNALLEAEPEYLLENQRNVDKCETRAQVVLNMRCTVVLIDMFILLRLIIKDS